MLYSHKKQITNMKQITYISILAFTIALLGCRNNKSVQQEIPLNMEILTSNTLLEYNKQMIAIQKAEMDSFARVSPDSFLTTPTGVYYTIPVGKDYQTVAPNTMVTVTYNITLLDGTICYNTRQEKLGIGSNTNIRGISEALEYLAIGYPSKLLVPYYLAYGLPGNDKVPSASPILINIVVEN